MTGPASPPGDTPDNAPDLGALMQAAQNGDAAAYGTLLRAISPTIKRFLKSRLFSDAALDDILQDILLALHSARHTYRPEQPFAHWMFGIARHKLIDYFRRHGRKQSREVSGDDLVTFMADTANTPEEALSYKDIRQALRRLPDKQRKIVTLTKIEGYSMAETAAKLGMSETAVKVTAHRAYKKLKEWLIADGYA